MSLLSKTTFMQALRCPNLLYMELNHPELKENIKTTSLGSYFGEEARKVYPNLITIPHNPPSKMAENTKKAIAIGFSNIAEATFIYNDMTCACDIFHVIDATKKEAEIYEVKSVTSYAPHHVLDVAFQTNILRNLGWVIKKVHIVTVDSSYVNESGVPDPSKVFKANDVTNKVESELLNIQEKIDRARKILQDVSDKAPEVKLGEQCKCGFDCPFLGHCINSKSADVFSIGSMRFSTKTKLYNAGISSYQDIIDRQEEYKIANAHVIQAKVHLTGKDHIEKDNIRNFIQTFKFPLYFLDFESFQMAMPKWKGSRAYSQIAFQYSLHKMGPSGKLKHMEFIGESGKDPRRAIAESLCENIKRKGTILAYNSSFEKARIRELAELYPDLRKKLLQIEKRIEDLMVPFQKRWFYKAAQNGSYSIKAVLPALYPNDPSLDYHSLDVIHNGEEAMTEYAKLDSYSEDEQKIIIEALLKYCCLDTYALVRVYEYLRSIVL